VIKRALDIPKLVRLEALKVNDQRARGPCGIVLEKVCEEVEVVVRNDSHGVALADGESVHDDFVGEMMDVVFNRAFEIFEIMGHLVGKQIEPASLHGENTRVDPVPLRWC